MSSQRHKCSEHLKVGLGQLSVGSGGLSVCSGCLSVGSGRLSGGWWLLYGHGNVLEILSHLEKLKSEKMPGCRGRHTSEQTRWASGNTCIIKGKDTVCKVQQSQVSFCSMPIICLHWGFKKTTDMSLNLLFRSWLTPTARWEACLSKLFGELGKITAGSDLGKNWACTSTSHAGTHRSHRSWSLQFQHSRSWKHSYSET